MREQALGEENQCPYAAQQGTQQRGAAQGAETHLGPRPC